MAGQRAGHHLPGLESIEKSIARHEKGAVRPDSLYSSLYRIVYDIKDSESTAAEGQELTIKSHKFMLSHVDPFHIPQSYLDGDEVTGALFPCRRIANLSPFGPGNIYSFPFGTILFHLTEEESWGSLGGLASWRIATYAENIPWFGELISEEVGYNISCSYILSAYWVSQSAYNADELVTATHLLSVPKTLLRTDGEAQPLEVERELINSRWRHPQVNDYGVEGIAVGAASWSGVAYAPIDPTRALAESEIVRYELGLQALWAYCDYISRTDESGDEVVIAPEYGATFLRRARSRLTMARPQESGQHRAMRTAILETSGVVQIIDNAIDILREK